ncbi:MAG: hypothetical protein ABIN91_21365 [Mucilaginibacter sp.]|uniref:hypothetical protein n=1 Tax=Mucilaginibacter sp. TaxID=1882438 RepID=UPI003264DF87
MDAQILISFDRIAIVGKDQFLALTDNLAGGNLKKKLQKLTAKLIELPPVDPKDQPFAISVIQQELNALLPEPSNLEKPNLNVILKRASKGENVLSKYQEYIRDGISALSVLSGDDDVPAMSNFVSSYLKHFEGQKSPCRTSILVS